MTVLSCIVCNYQPEPALEDNTNQPYKATCFTSTGHYGSTFFDPMDGSYIEINVCDECLTKAKNKRQILYYKEKMNGYRREVYE